MNKRIQEFAEQAGFGSIWFEEAKPGHPALPREGIVKTFAESIVKECAEVAGCNGHVSGFALGDLIKEHFGIKE